jgi:hypothetical protein
MRLALGLTIFAGCAATSGDLRCPAAEIQNVDGVCSVPLEKDADLEALELSPVTLERLRKESRGLIHYDDFVKRLPLSPRELYFGIYRSRLTLEMDLSPAGMYPPDLLKFKTENLEQSMKDCMDPASGIVFFIPPQIQSFQGISATSHEFQVLLRKPDWMKKTIFVYGGYQRLKLLRNSPDLFLRPKSFTPPKTPGN